MKVKLVPAPTASSSRPTRPNNKPVYRKLDKKEFTLKKIYRFADRPQILHPDNNHAKHKTRQQMLRDEGVVEFVRSGHYLLRIELTLLYKNSS